MLIEASFRFVAAGPRQGSFLFWTTMSEPIGRRVALGKPSVGLLSRAAEVYEVTHSSLIPFIAPALPCHAEIKRIRLGAAWRSGDR